MSPTIHREDGYVFYFVSFDIISGEPPHVHIGEGSQRPAQDAKIWLDPLGVAHSGRFRQRTLRRILSIVAANQAKFLEDWHDYKNRI